MKGGEEVFRWLVRHHAEVNLPACYRYMDHNSQICSPTTGQPYLEKVENELYTGFLIVANGNTLPARLKRDEVIKDETIDEFIDVSDPAKFSGYLKQQSKEGNDGGYIYNSIDERIARIYEFNNNPAPSLLRQLQQVTLNFLAYLGMIEKANNENSMLKTVIPRDFVSFDESIPAVGKHLGLKTRLAYRLPQMYSDTETFQIKRSSYANLRMGKVTHFDGQGLVEEVSLHYDPAERVGPFICREKHIIALYRRYRDEEGTLNRDINGELVPAIEEIVDPLLCNREGQVIHDTLRKVA